MNGNSTFPERLTDLNRSYDGKKLEYRNARKRDRRQRRNGQKMEKRTAFHTLTAIP